LFKTYTDPKLLRNFMLCVSSLIKHCPGDYVNNRLSKYYTTICAQETSIS